MVLPAALILPHSKMTVTEIVLPIDTTGHPHWVTLPPPLPGIKKQFAQAIPGNNNYPPEFNSLSALISTPYPITSKQTDKFKAEKDTLALFLLL